MKILVLTREYPPEVYGGAGVHVDHLARALAEHVEVEVRAFGSPEPGRGIQRVEGFGFWESILEEADPKLARVLGPLSVDLAMAAAPAEADIVHTHTWYAGFAGVLVRELYGCRLVSTVHSLEPHRPWKADALGRGYQLSTWLERTTLTGADRVIAVSEGSRGDLLEVYPVDPERISVVPNGIDLEIYRPVDPRPALERFGIDPARPYVLFVGRVSRQKGIVHLLHALQRLSPEVQLVLVTGAADSTAAEEAFEAALATAGRAVLRIDEMVPVDLLKGLYSGARVFACPSIYEPFGIINLEAMACRTPVVASRVGGIPEVVVHGHTGLLVDCAIGDGLVPEDPEGFEAALAESIRRLVEDDALHERMAEAGRRHVEAHFSWDSIARRTLEVYRRTLAAPIASEARRSP